MLDFKEGFQWNAIVHRKPGEVDWPNPNLDVAYSEAWVAVDDKSYSLTFRFYRPKGALADRTYFPPPLEPA